MGVLFSYNSFLFLVFLAGSIGYGLWTMCFLHKRKLFDYMIFEKQSASNNKVYQLLTFMQEIKLQGGEGRRAGEWEALQKELLDIQMRSLSLQQFQQTGGIFISQSKNLVVTVIAAVSVIEGEMTLGMLLAVQFIIGQLNIPIEQLMQFLYNFQNVRLSIERISAIHGKAEERTGKEIPEQPEISRKDIRIEHLDFKYNLHGKAKVLDDITLTIPAQRTTAIVGASGSGKTTLVKLLLGYFAPTSGNIFLGDTPLQDYDMTSWRHSCGVVLQDSHVFSESLARNIAVEDKHIDRTRLRTAARQANLEEFIEKLPLKYQTMVGAEGVGLSRGQEQRIFIARALYKDPSFVFLDEATNSLDANNERIITGNLLDFCKGRTVLIVAHRLSTIRHADKIVVLHKGRIVEEGTHDELCARHGYYYELINNQLIAMG
jgi:ABC transporter, ATP-binding protein